MTRFAANSFMNDARKRGLDELSIDNLRCGRITRQCMRYVRKKVEGLDGDLDLFAADELNDLLEAARFLNEEYEDKSSNGWA